MSDLIDALPFPSIFVPWQKIKQGERQRKGERGKGEGGMSEAEVGEVREEPLKECVWNKRSREKED